MEGIIISAALGFGLAAALFVWLSASKTGKQPRGPSVQVHASIEELRAIGELVVFKIITKEIVTAHDHWLGEVGKKYFRWLISNKKMAMIFEFEIDFRYDLRSPEFKIESEGETAYRLRLPPCVYEIHIRDISFYDEQESKFMPWLVPDLLNRALGAGFNEEDKNRLKEEAKLQAAEMAKELTTKMRSEVQSSARQTLEALAKGFGAERVTIDFGEGRLTESAAGATLDANHASERSPLSAERA